MNAGKLLAMTTLLLFLSKEALCQPASLQKQFDEAVQVDDYHSILDSGHKLITNLIAENKKEEASGIYREMASACFFRGEFSKTIQYCTSGLSMLEKWLPATLAFKHTSTVAESYASISLLDSAGYWFVRSEKLLDQNPLVRVEAAPFVRVFYNNLGSFYLQKRDPENALLYFEKALDMAKEQKIPRAIGMAYNSLANHYHVMTQYDMAKKNYLGAMNYFEPVSVDNAWILHSISVNAYRSKNYQLAYEYIRKSISLYLKATREKDGLQNLYLEKKQLFQVARSCFQLKDLKGAEKSYSDYLAILTAEKQTRSEDLAFCLLGLGQVYEARGNLERALDFYQRAIIAASISFDSLSPDRNPDVDDQLSGLALLEILQQKARCLTKTVPPPGESRQRLEWAFEAYYHAILIGERLRKDMNNEASKMFFSEKLRPVFDAAIDLGFRLSSQTGNRETWVGKTISILEKSRRVVLSDVLHEKDIRPGTIPKAMLEKEKKLLSSISEAKIEYAQSRDPRQVDSIRLSIGNLQTDIQKLTREMEFHNPAYVAQRHKDHPFDLKKNRSGIAPDAAYLGYYFGEKHLYVYVITENSEQIKKLRLPPGFDANFETLYNSLTADPFLYAFDRTKDSEWLYEVLVTPVYDVLRNYKRWFIARDAMLHLIPFEVLRRKGGEKFLIEDHLISYIHSADMLTSTPAKQRFATNTVGFAPFSSPYGVDSASWLRYTEKEIRKTSNLSILGPDASKEMFLKMLEQADILHLATHAVYNDSLPENSYVSFSPTRDNHRLHAHEIANLSLSHVKMAVLSFCDAEKGKAYNGEGVVSLARAFRLAGCPGTLASLWKADDEITSFIVSNFFRHLKNGSRPDEALTLAKTDYFASPLGIAHNHPYYWANIVYFGDTSPVFSAGFTPLKGIALGMVPLTAMLLGVYLFKKRRKQPEAQTYV